MFWEHPKKVCFTKFDTAVPHSIIFSIYTKAFSLAESFIHHMQITIVGDDIAYLKIDQCTHIHCIRVIVKCIGNHYHVQRCLQLPLVPKLPTEYMLLCMDPKRAIVSTVQRNNADTIGFDNNIYKHCQTTSDVTI